MRTIAVDLTPVLPGGENGGAKVFALELLRRLALLAPSTKFILLTEASAHEELRLLDSANVTRLLVLNKKQQVRRRPLSRRIAGRLVRMLSRPLQDRIRQSLRGKRKPRSQSLLRSLNADLLFCPFTAPTYFDIKVPLVSVIYDLQYKAYPQFFAEREVIEREQTFDAAAHRATMLVAISDFSRTAAIVDGNVDPQIIRTVHLHISADRLREAQRDDTVLATLNVSVGDYLVYPANFWKHKNHEMLLAAFRIACSNGLRDEVRLVCTGAPGERQLWLRRAAEGLGLGDRVIFPGYLTNAQMASLISNSAGVIFPSLYEGFGLPVIEAMVQHVPVACSNVTSLPEVAGDAALLFDPRIPEQVSNAMIALTGDKSLAARLIAAGDSRAKEFSDSELMARQYWDIFNEAAARRRRSNFITGVFVDAWVGPQIEIQIEPGSRPRTLEITFLTPGWTPLKSQIVEIARDGKIFHEAKGDPDQLMAISLPIPQEGDFLEIMLAKSFIPFAVGIGDDHRELAALLMRCDVVDDAGERVVIHPGHGAA